MLGSRFKILLADAGLSPEAAGKLLHVTPRTIRNWISGRVTVPYSAYKLVRVMRLFELPCEGWDGWHMHSGKLWTPEGFGFTPDCQSWWSLLVRQARLFREMYDRDRQLDIALQRASEGTARPLATPSAIGRRPAPGAVAADAPNGVAGRAAKPTVPNLLLGQLTTVKGEKVGFHRGNQFTEYAPNWSVVTNKGGQNG